MFETTPGLFYVLSLFEGYTTGASVFTLTSGGKFNLIYSLQPFTQAYMLVQATNSRLYGAGYLSSPPPPQSYYFSLDLAGERFQQYPTGKWSSGGPAIVVPPGELYDLVGANPTNHSTIYGFARISESGRVTILHQFSGSDGAPNGYNIVYGADGNIYGIGDQNPNGGPGFIFRFTQNGTYSQLLSFPSTVTSTVPPYPLLAASDGNLYGTFWQGGANHTGQIYQATLSGQFQTVASFPATSMIHPGSLMQAADGNIYGTTYSNDIFRYTPATQQLVRVYHLAVSQGRCTCQLIEGMDGKLYGVTASGGNPPGIGAVFSLDIGLPKPAPVVSGLYPASGPVGKKVILWGNYLLGATSVTFNGTPASSVVATSVQSVYTTVPVGATTGPVTITTANGSFTTTENFTVQ